jgi:hypothetical protein
MRNLVLGFALLVAACAGGATTYTPSHAFDAAEWEWALGTGTGAIHGEAFLLTEGGFVQTCAGETVRLIPGGPWTRELLRAAKSGTYTVEGPTEEQRGKWTRTTTCDVEGRFAFDGLPGGEYMAYVTVAWEQGAYGLSEGGIVAGLVQVSDGQTTKLTLSTGDRTY